MISLEEFREDYINEINLTAIENSEHQPDAFIDEMSETLIEDFSIINGLDRCFYSFNKGTKAFKNMQIDGIFTHLYNAKNKIDCKQQISIFMQYLAILKKYIDVSKIIKHTSSSLPATNFKNFRFDMVRLGIMLFASIFK